MKTKLIFAGILIVGLAACEKHDTMMMDDGMKSGDAMMSDSAMMMDEGMKDGAVVEADMMMSDG